MKEVKWIGEERMIPGVGVGTQGSVLNMPTQMADSFIKQGLAKELTVKKVTKKESE